MSSSSPSEDPANGEEGWEVGEGARGLGAVLFKLREGSLGTGQGIRALCQRRKGRAGQDQSCTKLHQDVKGNKIEEPRCLCQTLSVQCRGCGKWLCSGCHAGDKVGVNLQADFQLWGWLALGTAAAWLWFAVSAMICQGVLDNSFWQAQGCGEWVMVS